MIKTIMYYLQKIHFNFFKEVKINKVACLHLINFNFFEKKVGFL